MAASTSMRMPSSVSPANNLHDPSMSPYVGGPAAGPVEERRRDGVVAGIGEAAGDVLDVLVDAERLLDDDHRRRVASPSGAAS